MKIKLADISVLKTINKIKKEEIILLPIKNSRKQKLRVNLQKSLLKRSKVMKETNQVKRRRKRLLRFKKKKRRKRKKRLFNYRKQSIFKKNKMKYMLINKSCSKRLVNQ